MNGFWVWKTWGRLAIVVALLIGAYIGLVSLIGFADRIALAINFFRVAVAAAVLVLYVPMLPTIFQEVPAPRRDYLIAGIILSWGSAEFFAIGNEFGRIFRVDMSIFLNPIAGFFSLMLCIGGIFHFSAPDLTDAQRLRLVAVAVGLIMGLLVVFVAPLFRP